MKKLLKTNNLIILFITAAVLYGCSSKSGKEEFTARVNKSYLSKSEIDSITSNSNDYKSEVIRNWVNRELLYQEALKEGILDSKEFQDIIDNSKKELAAALMLKKVSDKQEIKIDQESLKAYYSGHLSEYTSSEDSFLMNILHVNSEDKAIKYRNLLLENNLSRLSSAAASEKSGFSNEKNVLKAETDLHPVSLLRAVNELNPGETSIVINDGSNSFYIVQLINKFPKGTIPPFELIKSEVEKRYTLEMRNKYIREYLEELYSNNDIEIRTGKK